MTALTPSTTRRVRRFAMQRWLLDAVIQTVGLEWDQGRIGYSMAPCGVLRCAIDSFGADRLLLGTDFPYENGDIFIRAVNYVNDPQIDPDTARAILDRNASALLGIR